MIQVNDDSCTDELIQLRRDLADVEFLCTRLYTQDYSRFDGSSYRYLVRVAVSGDIQSIVESLRREFSPATSRWLTRTGFLERLLSRLPREVLTRVELTSATPVEDSVNECLARARPALQFSLWGLMPYAWSFVALSRLIRALGVPEPAADELESQALLSSYHHSGFIKARRRCPETWDTLKGSYIYDSRGVYFALQLTRELLERELLTSDSMFLDIGSGIGTMPLAVAIASSAHGTGIEIHPQLALVAQSMLLKMSRKCPGLNDRVVLLGGDFRDSADMDLRRYDLIYVYSPLGTQELHLDDIIPQMKRGSLIISERIPSESLELVRFEPRISDLFAMRRV